MARMVKKKKKNYRLRKSVRRTLGALFMISAIIVAAIPFPDAAATDGITPIEEDNASITVEPLPDFSYGITADGKIAGTDPAVDAYDSDINKGINLLGPFSEGVEYGSEQYRTEFNQLVEKDIIKSAFTMRFTEEGIWQYEEQFKYYLLDSSNNAINEAAPTSNSGAVIVKYNNEYSVKDITLASTINSGSYVQVSSSEFNSYFNDKDDSKKKALTYAEKDQEAVISKFSYYFPQVYESFLSNVKNYEAYKTFITNNPDATEEELAKYPIKTPEQVTVYGDPTTAQLRTGTKGEYYCDYVINTNPKYNNFNLFGLNFEMIAVEDPTANSSTIEIKYIAKAKDKDSANNAAGFRIDTNGFLYTSTTENTYTLKGIAEGAFSGVTNSMTLKLPESIKYIGDEAFMGSFVTEIDITNVEGIGNRAFKGSQLSKVTMNTQTKYIGTESFSRTLLTSVELPYSILKIGKGAFSYNEFLTNVSINNTNTVLTIDDYAFFECVNLMSQLLGSKKIDYIGDGAFAIETIDSGNCTRFEFPNSLDDGSKIGSFVFGNRTNLENVVMPNLLGQTLPTDLDSTIFKGCEKLSSVIFPESCRYVSFENNIFSEVTNPDFYVKGPEISKNDSPAYPRTSTWECIMGVVRPDGDIAYVPYVFVDSITKEEFYEVGKGDYRFLINSQGILQSCKFVGDAKITDLVIPGTVGNISVSAIGEECFGEDFISYIKSVTIEDGGALKVISDNAFANADKLEWVDVGDSVESIGSEAFKDCTSLNKVTFGKGINLIGERAFKGCSNLEVVKFEKPDNLTSFTKDRILTDAFQINENENADANLTFIGEIHRDYGPYAYAMDPESFVNRTMGTRICYKTGDPLNLTVILDNRNNYPTLVDYLHYSDLEEIEAYYVDNKIPTIDDENDTYGIATIDDDSASNPSNDSNTTPENGSSDNSGNNNGSDSGNGTSSKEPIKSNLRYKYEKYPEQLTAMENYLVNAVINVEIPEGIDSIDVRGFIASNSLETSDAKYSKLGNSINVITYLQNPEIILPGKLNCYKEYGLFNSNFENDLGDEIGNDVVESITMSSVKYLPNNDSKIAKEVLSENGLSGGAFYDCDNLQTVILGSAMEDVGSLPFLGCHKLNSVACSSTNNNGEQRYVCNNKILYENTDENTVRLVECLGSRGYSQDGKVNVDADPDLLNVSELAVGCFSDCPELKTVSFTDNTLLTTIPDKTFLNDDLLRTVELPENIRNIGQKAFAEGGSGLGVWIYGREVSMATDSFDNTQGATVYTYLDTAAYNTAIRLLGSENVEPIPEGYRVRFFDYDGITELIDVQYVEKGENAIPPENDPVREGYIFKGWNKPYKNITENTDIIALYDVDPNNPGGLGPGAGGSGGNGNGSGNGGTDTDGDGIPDEDANGNKLYKLTVSNGEGSGSYPAGKTVTIKAGNAPKGATFAYWSCSNDDVIFEDSTDWITTLTMVASDVTVIANYTGQYTLEVEYGSGSGSYPAGAKVAISAVEAPQGRKFASWVTNTSGLNIENSRKESTVITMPASNAKITATYMDTGSISGNSTTKPSQNGTSVIITKPGISDKDVASAYVSGSSDNFIVKISESLEAADEVQKALQKKYPDMTRIKYFAMDISLYDAKGVNKITDTNGLKVNITMPIPDALREYAGNNRVGAVVNGELETLNPKFTTINGVPSITFTATHFSPYTIYVDTGNLTVGNTLDSTPKTGDGIHPKWFISIALACISIILFTKRDRRYSVKAYR